jgi:hypothetical protein
VGDGVGEQVLLLVEAVVLVGVLEAGVVELVELVAQQVDLAGPGALVAAELGELLLERGDLGPGVPQRLPRSTPAKRSRAWRCDRRPAAADWWACWPCSSTSRRRARPAR